MFVLIYIYQVSDDNDSDSIASSSPYDEHVSSSSSTFPNNRLDDMNTNDHHYGAARASSTPPSSSSLYAGSPMIQSPLPSSLSLLTLPTPASSSLSGGMSPPKTGRSMNQRSLLFGYRREDNGPSSRPLSMNRSSSDTTSLVSSSSSRGILSSIRSQSCSNGNHKQCRTPDRPKCRSFSGTFRFFIHRSREDGSIKCSSTSRVMAARTVLTMLAAANTTLVSPSSVRSRSSSVSSSSSSPSISSMSSMSPPSSPLGLAAPAS
jgi:hypothetical protein